MLGIDYSQPAIDLARAIASKREADGMRFETVDLFDAAQVDRLGQFDLILDKVRRCAETGLIGRARSTRSA